MRFAGRTQAHAGGDSFPYPQPNRPAQPSQPALPLGRLYAGRLGYERANRLLVVPPGTVMVLVNDVRVSGRLERVGVGPSIRIEAGIVQGREERAGRAM